MNLDLSTEELKHRLADPLWRVRNLYTIVTDDTQEIPLIPNPEQELLLKRLHNANLILKARQLGFCVDPSTRVLTADLRWVAIADIQPGDEVVATDELVPGGRGAARRMRTAFVIGKRTMRADRWRITFDDWRQVICTDRHPWLSKKVATDAQWRSLSGEGNCVVGQLTVGTRVRWITKPWGKPSFEDGWFGGILDGEGSMATPARAGASVNASQRPGPVWDRMVRYAQERGYSARVESDAAERPSKHGRVPVPKLAFTRMDELFRLLGQTRPSRFIGARWWEGRELPGKRNGDVGWSTIVGIEPMGEGDVVDLQTSERTYIAEGFVSHNTTFIDVLALDQCLFNANFTAGIIAHSLPDAQKIFRNKVRKVYDSLPRLVQNMCPIRTASASEIVFENGSSISVGTSSRGGTLQFLHVSEMGKIARKYPEKAAEIVSGAFESVPLSGIKIVESTAEGRQGWFFQAVMEAMRRRQAGSKDTPLDFRLHFYPWFTKADYRLDPTGVVLSDSDRRYFAELEFKRGIKLDPSQKAWYVKKRATLGELMLREYPSTEEEAFQASVAGMIYAAEMKALRLLGKIGAVSLRPELPVNTFWDFGVNDHNSIWLHQRVGAMNRFVRFFQDQNQGLAHYWKLLEGWRIENGAKWGRHYLPHDADTRLQGAEVFTRKQVLVELGMREDTIVVVPRTPSVNDAIDLVKRILPDCEFDEEGCDEGLDALDNYSRKWDENVGDWSREPRHDVFSHGADAFRQFAQAFAIGPQDAGNSSGFGMVLPASYGRGGY